MNKRYLCRERGLAQSTIRQHLFIVLRFLQETCTGGTECLGSLTPFDITAFVERHARHRSPHWASSLCSTLRTFLRYLQYRGQINAQLATSVPTIRRWSCSSLPSYLSPAQVQKVLDGCDRRKPLGRRDYAILITLSRLGLRANEIATLTLDDLDWRSAELMVHGKGGQRATMPLYDDVGKAIASYIRHDRPTSDSRRIFLRGIAPHNGFASSSAITTIANRALTRANISGIAHRSAHVFRHSLATALLRAGASLTEIGQVLRHQDQNTTRIYAKVDIDALRLLGQPWPGSVR